jgi:hypothetical protein
LLLAKRDLHLEKELAVIDGFDAVILDDIGYVQQSRDEMEVPSGPATRPRAGGRRPATPAPAWTPRGPRCAKPSRIRLCERVRAEAGDAGKDLVGALGPDERLWVIVGRVDVALDGLAQLAGADVAAPRDAARNSSGRLNLAHRSTTLKHLVVRRDEG